MNTVNKNIPEVAMIMANATPIENWQIYWLISKMQVEYILTDITASPADIEHSHLQQAQYQEETLPVISLEKFYGLEELPLSSIPRYIVTKSPAADGDLIRAILRTYHPVRIRRLDFTATHALLPRLTKNSTDILGAFTLPDNQLVIIPNIDAILVKLQ